MSAVDLFEELRFVWELMGAEFIFLLPFIKLKKRHLVYLFVGSTGFSLISVGYFGVKQLGQYLPLSIFQMIICGWYILLALLTIFYLKICFQLTVHNALYVGVSGYAAQHLVYVLIHEVLALGLLPELPQYLMLYLLISISVCSVVYILLYRIFAPRLRQCGGALFDEDTTEGVVASMILLTLLMICAFTGQYIFRNSETMRYPGAAMDGIFCVVTLCVQYVSLRMILSARETVAIEQILRDSEQHYRFSKEVIEQVNQSCHDMKHQLQALRLVGEKERETFVDETMDQIHLYQRMVHTDNEVLNTILAEKALYCDSLNIQFSCAINHVDLDFISVTDLYALLGNAINNAIEYVNGLSEPEKRVISLTVQSHNAFVSIQTNNYFEGTLKLENGLPVTTKKDRLRHGYGLKSIRYIAKKYGGVMYVTASDHLFTLQITLPVSQ